MLVVSTKASLCAHATQLCPKLVTHTREGVLAEGGTIANQLSSETGWVQTHVQLISSNLVNSI